MGQVAPAKGLSGRPSWPVEHGWKLLDTGALYRLLASPRNHGG